MGIEDKDVGAWSDPHERFALLARDELSIFCQPIQALSGAAGYPMAEALIRMREEESAHLPPGDFLPVFEHFGMMPQLDRWILQRLVEQLSAGCEFPGLSMNVSVPTLGDEEFPKFFSDCVLNAGIAASSVLFEVEERDLLSHPDAARSFISSIRSAGGGIVIDGFGRESISSVALESLGPDYLKVDGAIIRNLLNNSTAGTKLEAVLRVANSLQIGVIADCVEEQEILAWLKVLGVGFAQGSGLSLPRPIKHYSRGDSPTSAVPQLDAGSDESALITQF